LAFAGDLTFNPATDELVGANGEKFKLQPPEGVQVPPKGFDIGTDTYQAPSSDPNSVNVVIRPDSERLQLLKPFKPWNKQDFINCVVLIKVKGKCTTDHIAAAGPWLKYRGHLDNSCNNLLIGAINSANGKTNCVANYFTDQYAEVPTVARYYLKYNHDWVIIGDENYGEGSAREHAALQVRKKNEK
jgi:aconitate hydratase